MIKSELIAAVSSQMTGLAEHKISESVNLILETMKQSLTNGERVEIRGFGSFSVHVRNPRQARNPKTGEKLLTKTKYTPHFKPGKELRERINESRNQHPIVDQDA